jgi:hypothetical protein
MVSAKSEKNGIYKRLHELRTIINPNNNMFMIEDNHPLCAERDALIDVYYQYLAYER